MKLGEYIFTNFYRFMKHYKLDKLIQEVEMPDAAVWLIQITSGHDSYARWRLTGSVYIFNPEVISASTLSPLDHSIYVQYHPLYGFLNQIICIQA